MKKDVLISLCMIVKNEEDTIARCLSSIASFVDEIIIVDTGSTDKTKEIVGEFTDKIYDFVWCDDFGKARNFSFSKASGKYVMWLDADDVVLPEDLKKLISLRDRLREEKTDVFMLKYNISFDENGKPTYTYFRERILKNVEGLKWQGFIHEAITPFGNVEYLDIAIKHSKIHSGDPKRNLNIYNKKRAEGVEFSARDMYYFARELYYNKFYEEAISEFDNLLKRNDVWIEDRIGAVEIKAKCEIELKMYDDALNTAFQSFKMDIPRANILCLVGDIFIYKNCHNIAIYWFELALKCQISSNSRGFQNLDYFGYYPYLQLSVCYFKVGNPVKSYECNCKAMEIKPSNKTVLDNDKFFKDYFKKNNIKID